jgi:hypothetical protein
MAYLSMDVVDSAAFRIIESGGPRYEHLISI